MYLQYLAKTPETSTSGPHQRHKPSKPSEANLQQSQAILVAGSTPKSPAGPGLLVGALSCDGTAAPRPRHHRSSSSAPQASYIFLHNNSPTPLYIAPVVTDLLNHTASDASIQSAIFRAADDLPTPPTLNYPYTPHSPIGRHTGQDLSCPPWPTLPAAAERLLSN